MKRQKWTERNRHRGTRPADTKTYKNNEAKNRDKRQTDSENRYDEGGGGGSGLAGWTGS